MHLMLGACQSIKYRNRPVGVKMPHDNCILDLAGLPDFTVVSPQFSGRSKKSSRPLLLVVVCRARH